MTASGRPSTRDGWRKTLGAAAAACSSARGHRSPAGWRWAARTSRTDCSSGPHTWCMGDTPAPAEPNGHAPWWPQRGTATGGAR
eukprot:12983942-Alexandrium_andersonii.AAC.1